MRRLLVTLGAVALLSALSGCYSLEQHRKLAVPRAGDCPEDTEPSQCAFILHEEKDQSPYSLGVVEFDDQGATYDVPQLAPFLKTLEQDSDDTQGRIVLVFAHGWFHDARPGDSNLSFFRDMLEQFSAAERNAVAAGAQQKPRRVVGLYLAWRGAAWKIPGLSYVTFWSRKDAAHRIGERQVTETLIKIRQAAYRVSTASRGEGEASSAPPNRLVIMGHSFGAALVHSALSQLIANSLLSRPLEGAETLPLADAILLFNPAFEAARMHHLLVDAATLKRPRPVLTVLTAETDRATGWAFPAARWVNNIFGSFRDDIENPLRAGTIAQRSANAKTVGHYEPYLTHDMQHVKASAQQRWDPDERRRKSARGSRAERARLYNETEEALRDAAAQHDRERSMTFGETRLVPRPGLLHEQLSVYNIRMPRQIWSGHSLEQDEPRRKRILSFLMLYIPFSGAAPRPEDVLAPEKIELQAPSAAPRSAPAARPEPPPQVPDARLTPRSLPRF